MQTLHIQDLPEIVEDVYPKTPNRKKKLDRGSTKTIPGKCNKRCH